jgi:uncharacterized cupredoxin-like copper-binding protein
MKARLSVRRHNARIVPEGCAAHRLRSPGAKKTALAALALVALGGCATTPPADLPTAARAQIESDGAQHVDLVAGSYWFRPKDVVVKAGAPVTLSVRQEGVIPHTFIMEAPQAGIDVHLHLGTQPQFVHFTPTHAGHYLFYCNEDSAFSNHLEKGMWGRLDVVD